MGDGQSSVAQLERLTVVRIAYLLDVFPVLSETFIVREIDALKRRGEAVMVFAIQRRTSEVTHADSVALLEAVEFLSEARRSRTKRSVVPLHLKYLAKRPASYLTALLAGARGSRRVRQSFFWSPLYAERLVDAGIQHMHAHFVLDGCLYAMFISMLTGIPYSVTVHAHDIFHSKYEELRGEKLRRAAFVAAISSFNKRFVETKYPFLAPENIRVVHCGIGLEEFAVARHCAGRESRKVLAVGRLVEQKGFIHLIEACALLRRRGVHGFSVDIIGEGDERGALESCVRTLGLEDTVNLLGQRDQVFVRAALDSADVFVLPCVQQANGMMDGIPVALMEAMAKGVPVISTRVSGVPELIVDGGYVVEPANVESLADAMHDVLAMSGVQRRALGERGRAIVEREFSIDHEAEKLAAFISGARAEFAL